MRSTTTCRVDRSLSTAVSMSSKGTARPSMSRRPNPFRRSVSIVAAMASAPGRRRLERRHGSAAALVGGAAEQVGHFSRFIDFFRRLGRGGPRDRRLDDRRIRNRGGRVPRQPAELARDDLGRLAHDLPAAVPAERPPDAREQQPHVVVNFRRRADRRPRDCGCCSSGGWRSRARCRRCDRRRASPSARGTGARRRTAIRRSAAALRRRSCRRRATTSPIR